MYAHVHMKHVESAAPAPDVNPHRRRLIDGMPLAERRLQLAGVSTSVLEGGAGTPIVLLHGPGEFAAKWLRVVPELTGRYRVIAPDLPGHGESHLADGRIDADGVLRWLGQLIDATCASPPVLVGHVLGGAIAARYAVRHSERLCHLVLVDSLGLMPFRPSIRFALTMIGFLARPNPRSYDRFMRQCSYDLDDLRDQMGDVWTSYEACSLDFARSPGAKAAGRIMRSVGVPRIPPADLARISVPTTLIWGRHDRANRVRGAEHVSACHGWPLHVIEDCADDPPRDRPRAFIDTLDDVLGPHGRGQTRGPAAASLAQEIGNRLRSGS